MKITPEENELLLELIIESGIKPLNPKVHVTTTMYAEAAGISTRSAYDQLEKKRLNGELKREKVRNENHRVVYGYFKDIEI